MSLAVLPVFRCRGVARQLLQHALQKAFQDGAKTVKLHVHTQNVGAIRLWLGWYKSVLEIDWISLFWMVEFEDWLKIGHSKSTGWSAFFSLWFKDSFVCPIFGHTLIRGPPQECGGTFAILEKLAVWYTEFEFSFLGRDWVVKCRFA